MNLRFCLLASALLWSVFTGCLNLDPTPDFTRFYTLVPSEMVAGASGLVDVEVSQLPYYAQTKRIPVRRGDVEVTYFVFDRWTGPLDVMLGARIRERLDPWAADAEAGAWTVEVKVLACEGVESGEARFSADYRLLQEGNPRPVASGRFLDSAPWDPEDGAESLASRLGVLVDAFSDRIAAILAEGNFPKLKAEDENEAVAP